MVLGYHPVGSSCIWVCLLNKCEISNSYCRAMTRFGMKPCEKIIFNSDLKCLSVLSNVDRKYYPCKEVAIHISKRRCILGSYKEKVARSHPLFSVRKQYFFTLKTLLAPPNTPLDV